MFCGCKSTYYVDYPVEIKATSDLEQKIPRKLETITDQDPINTESLRFQAHSQTFPKLFFLEPKTYTINSGKHITVCFK